MAKEEGYVNVDEYLDRTIGPQTIKCSETNLMRGMDFTGFISNNLTLNEMLRLFEISCGKRWCEHKWTAWVASGKSVWWLWTSLDLSSKRALCNWYMTSERRLDG